MSFAVCQGRNSSIAKLEKDLEVFHERTGEAFPEVLKQPTFIQIIPTSWKKEFETQLRSSGALKTYDALATQLVNIENGERYTETREGPDDMDIDAADKVWVDDEQQQHWAVWCNNAYSETMS